MRAIFDIGTKRMLGAQSDASDATLIQDAEAQGFARDKVEIRDISPAELSTILADLNAPARKVRKSIITARVTAAGKIDQAMSVLMSKPALFARWVASDRGDVNATDADTITFLQALGLDPAVILASDPED